MATADKVIAFVVITIIASVLYTMYTMMVYEEQKELACINRGLVYKSGSELSGCVVGRIQSQDPGSPF